MATTSSGLQTILARLLGSLRAAAVRLKERRTDRSLRLCETLALGERRLLLIVQCEKRRYLLGATAQTLTLIERLDSDSSASLAEFSAENVPWNGLQ